MNIASKCTLQISRLIRQFGVHSGAAAATEFALIVPLLVGIVISIDDVSNIMVGTASMQTASRSAVQYAMHGGTDMNAAKTLGMQAWDHKPADAAMTVVQACYCSGANSSCTAPCPDNSFPIKLVTVNVSGTYGGNVYHRTPQLTETVRLR
jgi:Flp pilus assembly protein TadG